MQRNAATSLAKDKDNTIDSSKKKSIRQIDLAVPPNVETGTTIVPVTTEIQKAIVAITRHTQIAHVTIPEGVDSMNTSVDVETQTSTPAITNIHNALVNLVTSFEVVDAIVDIVVESALGDAPYTHQPPHKGHQRSLNGGQSKTRAKSKQLLQIEAERTTA